MVTLLSQAGLWMPRPRHELTLDLFDLDLLAAHGGSGGTSWCKGNEYETLVECMRDSKTSWESRGKMKQTREQKRPVR